MNSSSLARIATAAVATAILAGCSAINPITTQLDYEASDGLAVAIGDDATAVNLIIVTEGIDSPAVLTGTVYNTATEDLAFSVSIDGTEVANITVDAGGSTRLGPGEGEQLVLGTATVAPGRIAEVAITTEADGVSTTPVPVMDGTLVEYRGVLEAIPAPPTA